MCQAVGLARGLITSQEAGNEGGYISVSGEIGESKPDKQQYDKYYYPEKQPAVDTAFNRPVTTFGLPAGLTVFR